MAAQINERYVLGERLGVGGMAEVFRAHDTLLDRAVAVKVFTPSTDPYAEARVRAEVRTLAGLSHRGLVTVYDAGTSGADGRPYLVMELVDGPSLAHQLKSGPMPPHAVAALTADVCEALAHAHEHSVIHRDIKPANILLDARGRGHVADFGVAHTLGEERLTAVGSLVGTAAYLSPEQVTGRTVTPAVDVYAMGLVALEALTGRREYPGLDVETALARLSRAPHIDEDLPRPWPELLVGMTALDPSARPSAADVVGLLRAAPSTDTTRAMAAPVPATQLMALPTATQAAPGSHRHRGRWVLVGVLAALALIVAAVLAASPGGRDPLDPTGTPAPPSPQSSPSPTPQSSSSSQVTISPTPSQALLPAPVKRKGKGKHP
jgi:serine/threonine protein kinase